MDKIKLSIYLVLLAAGVVQAQVNRYMVFFTDKTGTPYTISNPSAYLSPAAIERRETQNIIISESDLPLTPVYVQSVQNTGVTVVHKTKWMNGVLVECTSSDLPDIEALSFVSSIELVAPGAVPDPGGRKKSHKMRTSSTESVATADQLSMLGLDEMHADGFRGEGIILAVFDGGFQGANVTIPFQHVFNEARFNASVSHDFVSDNSNVFVYDSHGTQVWSVIGAYQDGTFIGGAYKSEFQLYITEDIDSEYRIEEYNWLFAAERADSAGVDIINTSLGYNTFDDSQMDYAKTDMDGSTAIIARAAQMAASKGIFLVSSAGNSGNDPSWQIITSPADGEDVLAVGNVNSTGMRSTSSSIGPSADGRIKPDVMALGAGTTVIKANGSVGTGNGTSFASPLAASLVAGLWQKYPDLTNQELLEAIRNSASQSFSPDNFSGYGIPHYRAVSNFLDQQNQQNIVEVFPNPVTDMITIRPRSPEEVGFTDLQLINSQGQTIDQRSVSYNWLDNEYTANLSAVSAGIYFLKVQVGTRFYMYKVVKQ